MGEAEFIGMMVICGAILIGMIVSITKPLKENTKAMTENTEQIKHITKDQEAYEKHNHDSHQRIWDHNDRQDEKLESHENRITVLEHNN